VITANLIALCYLLAAVGFVLGLKGLTHPRSARRGNALAMAGMALAIVATLLNPQVRSYGFILAGIAVGGTIGTVIALRVQMAAMPQLVALLHSFVGLCAVLVAVGTFVTHSGGGMTGRVQLFELAAGTLVGAITFTGSLVAFGKLQALLPTRPLIFPGRHALNLLLGAATVGVCALFVSDGGLGLLVWIALLACVLGVLLIIPIGGVDMPVIISMLNSYSGWAAAATGFTLGNPLLIITGGLVGFSGAILSYIMCRAMNRSFLNVLVGGFGGAAEEVAAAAAGNIRTASTEDVAFLMENATKVIIVPGYGMAVAQAQHALHDLVEELKARGVDTKFAIHPVAGRMPGHMNVLLAEADVPYEDVVEMEEINPQFSTCDVALVVGANDVTNPSARTDRASPLYGMPILEVYRARNVFFVKRSLKPGYSGVDNQLFYQDNCSLVFGDAKKVCEEIAANLRAG